MPIRMDSSAPVATPLPLTEALTEPPHPPDALIVADVEPVASVVSEAPPEPESAFTVPLISAILLHYALGKPVNWLEHVGVPRSLGAALVMCAALAATGSLFYGLWGQAENLLESLPRSAKRISNDFVKMRQAPGGTLRKVGEAAAAVTDMVNGQPATAKPKPAPAAAPEAVNTFLIKR